VIYPQFWSGSPLTVTATWERPTPPLPRSRYFPEVSFLLGWVQALLQPSLGPNVTLQGCLLPEGAGHTAPQQTCRCESVPPVYLPQPISPILEVLAFSLSISPSFLFFLVLFFFEASKTTFAASFPGRLPLRSFFLRRLFPFPFPSDQGCLSCPFISPPFFCAGRVLNAFPSART